MSGPTLSPSAVALLNAIAAATPHQADPWARFPPVLNVHHVGEILGMTPESASEAARRQDIPMRKILGRYMIDQLEFREWVASGGMAR